MLYYLDKGNILCRSGFILPHPRSFSQNDHCLVMLTLLTMLTMLGRLVLAVLTGQAEVLIDKELAGARVAGGEDGENNDDTCFHCYDQSLVTAVGWDF